MRSGPQAVQPREETPIALPPADIAAIRAKAAPFIASLVAGDAPALAAHYAEDATLYPPGREAVRGRAGIEAFFGAFPPVLGLLPEVEEIDGDGDIAFVRGTSVVVMASEEGAEPARQRLQFIELHRKQPDGRWLMTADIWNAAGGRSVT